MQKLRFLGPVTFAGLAACAPALPVQPAIVDAHSYARPHEARVTHVALDLRVDFTMQMLHGLATLSIDRDPGAPRIVLDTRDLAVERVTDARGTPLAFGLGDPDPILGRALTIDLPESEPTPAITIAYRTSPDAAALQWLAPAQTAGRAKPYLYSQGQAILTRTWIPTQDSPGIRQTYSARVVVPRGLRAVMSAELLTPTGVETDEGLAFDFRLTQPIPPYLIALAVGDLAFRELGTRTGVYTEPFVLDRAALELADLEVMVAAAEDLLGPYRWGRYDVLILPPSFPFGGMENPRLTFATPTVLAGDRSLVSLFAHELAHSWSGNLVTNATWSDFWLNEGVTSYVELRIMEALYGAERAAMLEALGLQELREELVRLGGATSPDTVLHLDLAGRDPDEGMTQVPYVKGAALFRLLERSVGRDRLDEYLRSYFDRHAFQPMTTAGFLADVGTHLLAGDRERERQLRLDEWLYQPGLPDNLPEPVSLAFDRVDAAARAFAASGETDPLETDAWSTQEWQRFLSALPATLTASDLAELDRAYSFTDRRNSEVLFTWLRLAIRHRYQPAMPALDRFLTGQGRRKFLVPLYGDLMAAEWGQTLARQIYARARPSYHAVSTQALDALVR